MQLVKYGIHLIILSFFYMLGTWIQQLFHLFIPGSIIGMLLLFLALSFKLISPHWIAQGSNLLIRHLPLLFIPVTVGVIQYLGVLAGKGMLLILIVWSSTLFVAVLSGASSQYLLRKRR